MIDLRGWWCTKSSYLSTETGYLSVLSVHTRTSDLEKCSLIDDAFIDRLINRTFLGFLFLKCLLVGSHPVCSSSGCSFCCAGVSGSLKLGRRGNVARIQPKHFGRSLPTPTSGCSSQLLSTLSTVLLVTQCQEK